MVLEQLESRFRGPGDCVISSPLEESVERGIQNEIGFSNIEIEKPASVDGSLHSQSVQTN